MDVSLQYPQAIQSGLKMLHGAPYAVSLNNQTRSALQVSIIPIPAGTASEHWQVTPGSAVIRYSRAENRSFYSFQLINSESSALYLLDHWDYCELKKKKIKSQLEECVCVALQGSALPDG